VNTEIVSEFLAQQCSQTLLATSGRTAVTSAIGGVSLPRA